MDRFLLIDHHDNPRDDLATTVVRELGYRTELVRPFMGESLPEPDDSIAGAVIYGGSMNVDEQDAHPYLVDELRWIERAMARELPLLGICLGGQLIAHSLGARVGNHPEGLCEFGYYEIHPVTGNLRGDEAWFSESMHVTQAHFQQFDLPPGAVRLATGETFENQAFRYGENTYGLQFHPEVTETIFRRWQDADWAFYGDPGAQTREQQDAVIAHAAPRQAAWFRGFLDNFFGPAGEIPLAAAQ